jgi:hypothetical protein
LSGGGQETTDLVAKRRVTEGGRENAMTVPEFLMLWLVVSVVGSLVMGRLLAEPELTGSFD